jgi:hypothetical protein
MINFFKKSKKEQKPIELGVNYFIKGESVVFKLNDLDFTFEKFYVTITNDSMKILVEDETPMNLMYLLDIVKDDLEANRKDILEADTVRFILKLNYEVFSKLKHKIIEVIEILDIFGFKLNGELPLKDFKNYELELYGTSKKFDDIPY